jgi:hypothetical protein
MKFFNFLKPKKDRLPKVKTLRPDIFNVNLIWYEILSVVFIIFIITCLVGFNFAYSQYFESYKQVKSPENYENLINIKHIKSVIETRNNFLNSSISLPKDPSL